MRCVRADTRRAGAQQVGRIHCAAFSDEVLHAEVVAKAAFWQQDNYYGVNLTHLLQPAIDGYLSQVRADSRHAVAQQV